MARGKILGRAARLPSTLGYGGYGMAAGAAIGATAAIASLNPFQGTANLALDAAFGTPNMRGSDTDNLIFGRDLGYGELFGFPYIGMTPKSVTAMRNLGSSQFLSDLGKYQADPFTGEWRVARSYKSARNRYNRTMNDVRDQGYTEDYYGAQTMGVPFRPSAMMRNVNAPGDMVFGMYNLRRQ